MNRRKLTALLLTAAMITGSFSNMAMAADISVVSPLQQEDVLELFDTVSEDISENAVGSADLPEGCYEEIGSAVESNGTTIIRGNRKSTQQADEEAVGGSLMKSGLISALKLSQKSIAKEKEAVITATERFATVPGTSSPYSLGSLTENYQQSAITYVNYIRKLAGLGTLSLNHNLNTSAQYGAVVLAANNKLTHSPAAPAGMNNNFYLQGKAAAGSSNIYTCYGYPDVNNTLRRSIDSYMKDNTSASNLLQMGHRRWVLYPGNVRTGFGQADAYEGNCYAVMKVMRDNTYDSEADDPDSDETADYNFISWPASGNFPSETFGTRVPWSVTVNPDVYSTPVISKLKVTVSRVSDTDGRSWTFTSADENKSPTNTKKYLNVNTSWTGINNCIIFNPGNEFDQTSYMGIYQVDIEGLTLKNGAATTLSYQVNFFDINSPDEGTDETNGYNPAPKDDDIDGKDDSSYTVTFHPENGEPDTVSTVSANNTVILPEQPLAPISGNNVFMGWCTGKNGEGTVFDESVQINHDYDVYAYWTKEETEAVTIDAAGLTINKITDKIYTGEAIRPDIVVKDGKTVLTENEHYRVGYRDNTQAGQATVIIYGMGNYNGTKTVNFTINKKKIGQADIWLEDQTANGFELVPKVHARDVAGELTKGTDYTIGAVTGSLVKPGKVTVTFVGAGNNYTGTVKKTFLICAATWQLVGDSNMSFDKSVNSSYDIDDNGAFLYTGNAIKPVLTITDSAGNTIAKKNYTVTYKNNKNAGTASVIVKGKKNYKGSFVKYFTIAKRDISTVTVAAVATKTYTGAAIKPKPYASVQVKSNGRVKTLQLKLKNDYKVSYSKNKNANNEETTAATITLTGTRNFTGQIPVHFTIAAKGLESGITVNGLKKYKSDGGNPIEPKLSLSYKNRLMEEGRDYTYVIKDNTEPGRATVIISAGTGGNFKGELTRYFKII